jgi:hypothetical protein
MREHTAAQYLRDASAMSEEEIRKRWPRPYIIKTCPKCKWPFHCPREQAERELCSPCDPARAAIVVKTQ